MIHHDFSTIFIIICLQLIGSSHCALSESNKRYILSIKNLAKFLYNNTWSEDRAACLKDFVIWSGQLEKFDYDGISSDFFNFFCSLSRDSSVISVTQIVALSCILLYIILSILFFKKY